MELTHPHNAISSLLGARAVDEQGRKLGRVRDISGMVGGDGTIVVEALLIGRHATLPWADVLSVDDGVITARSGTGWRG